MFIAAEEELLPPIVEAMDRVRETGDMVTMFAAEYFVTVDRARREALEDAARHGRELTEVVERGFRLELAAGMRITEHAAGDLIRRAEALVRRYPGAWESLSRAGMTVAHAEFLVDRLDECEPELRDALVGEAVALAEEYPVGPFRRALRKLIDLHRTVTLAQQHEAALVKRRVVVEHGDDGMAWLSAYLPAVEAHAIYGRLTKMAKAIKGHDETTSRVDDVTPPTGARTIDQLRADVLSDLLIEGDATVHPTEARGIRATVAVTVPALTLLTPSDTDADRAAAGLAPAVVEGLGPIPLDRARELCGGADGWMRILTHPETGMVLSVGRSQYRPPPMLRKLIRWRADRCMAPGCGIPASRCEIDHTIAWEYGGHTSLDNLAPLCKGHHTVKHHGGWRVRQVPDSGGALEWRSPAGRTYVVQPERRVPVFRPADAANAPF
ncbi:HNH endonuclease signature motif containing protein [Microbacterium immunditiarum]|uniref:HNH nuclease domain-containing protein n=1 Tax=Microbacterium immunditiarum TaxID=337480 RepID=A0A7Y9GMG0_9MICO|nr:HNH endonuclease signature motif containing protein [Microbacterium immunditiarum]NYE19198.1 hypothetical protein [Microbacterium immunditiarum]